MCTSCASAIETVSDVLQALVLEEFELEICVIDTDEFSF